MFQDAFRSTAHTAIRISSLIEENRLTPTSTLISNSDYADLLSCVSTWVKASISHITTAETRLRDMSSAYFDYIVNNTSRNFLVKLDFFKMPVPKNDPFFGVYLMEGISQYDSSDEARCLNRLALPELEPNMEEIIRTIDIITTPFDGSLSVHFSTEVSPMMFNNFIPGGYKALRAKLYDASFVSTIIPSFNSMLILIRVAAETNSANVTIPDWAKMFRVTGGVANLVNCFDNVALVSGTGSSYYMGVGKVTMSGFRSDGGIMTVGTGILMNFEFGDTISVSLTGDGTTGLFKFIAIEIKGRFMGSPDAWQQYATNRIPMRVANDVEVAPDYGLSGPVGNLATIVNACRSSILVSISDATTSMVRGVMDNISINWGNGFQPSVTVLNPASYIRDILNTKLPTGTYATNEQYMRVISHFRYYLALHIIFLRFYKRD
nr:MAG: hypothetical protein [Halyomorpha halys reo-like associated virus 1]